MRLARTLATLAVRNRGPARVFDVRVLAVLLVLEDGGETTVGGLRDALGVSVDAAVRWSRMAEAYGLVLSRVDGRCRRITITPAGARLVRPTKEEAHGGHHHVDDA